MLIKIFYELKCSLHQLILYVSVIFSLIFILSIYFSLELRSFKIELYGYEFQMAPRNTFRKCPAPLATSLRKDEFKDKLVDKVESNCGSNKEYKVESELADEFVNSPRDVFHITPHHIQGG